MELVFSLVKISVVVNFLIFVFCFRVEGIEVLMRII